MQLDKLREFIRELIKKELAEASVTGGIDGGAGQPKTPYAFKNPKDESYFWNSFSNTFFNLDFFKADEISYIDNHFIMESIPQYPFIIEHMPRKVQRVIGKPHPNAMPAYSLLRKQNFR